MAPPEKTPKQAPATQSSTKSARNSASTASAEPTSPTSAPKVKPARRPQRFIIREAGTVDSIIARNCTARGRVASAGSAARAPPTMAVMVISSEVLLIESGWQTASSETLRTVGSRRVTLPAEELPLSVRLAMGGEHRESRAQPPAPAAPGIAKGSAAPLVEVPQPDAGDEDPAQHVLAEQLRADLHQPFLDQLQVLGVLLDVAQRIEAVELGQEGVGQLGQPPVGIAEGRHVADLQLDHQRQVPGHHAFADQRHVERSELHVGRRRGRPGRSGLLPLQGRQSELP